MKTRFDPLVEFQLCFSHYHCSRMSVIMRLRLHGSLNVHFDQYSNLSHHPTTSSVISDHFYLPSFRCKVATYL